MRALLFKAVPKTIKARCRLQICIRATRLAASADLTVIYHLRAAPHRADSMLHKCVTTFLQNKDGKYVSVSTRDGVKLVAFDQQNGAINENLDIWKRDEKEFALFFKYGKKTYVLKVENELTLVLIQEDVKKYISQNEQGNTWFRKNNIGAGDHYCIQTASNPPKYLTVKEDRDTHIVTVLSEPKDSNSIFHVDPSGCLERCCTGM